MLLHLWQIEDDCANIWRLGDLLAIPINKCQDNIDNCQSDYYLYLTLSIIVNSNFSISTGRNIRTFMASSSASRWFRPEVCSFLSLDFYLKWWNWNWLNRKFFSDAICVCIGVSTVRRRRSCLRNLRVPAYPQYLHESWSQVDLSLILTNSCENICFKFYLRYT